jgi:hypothetical protein
MYGKTEENTDSINKVWCYRGRDRIRWRAAWNQQRHVVFACERYPDSSLDQTTDCPHNSSRFDTVPPRQQPSAPTHTHTSLLHISKSFRIVPTSRTMLFDLYRHNSVVTQRTTNQACLRVPTQYFEMYCRCHNKTFSPLFFSQSTSQLCLQKYSSN